MTIRQHITKALVGVTFAGICAVFSFSVPSHAQTAFDGRGAGGGAVMPGKDTRVCAAAIEGAVRYQSGQSSSISTANLLGYWRLDETVNTTAQDSSGNGYNGTLSGTTFAASTTPAIVNTGLNLDGVDDAVDLGTQAALKPALPASYVSWVYLSSATIASAASVPIFANDSQNTYSGLWITVNLQRIAAQIGSNTGMSPNNRRTKVTDPIVIQAGWYHIAIVWRGITDMSIYVNGADAGGAYTGTGAGLVYNAGNRTYIGRRDTDYFPGIIDEARFYGRALTADEVATIYAGNIQICTDKNGGYAWTNWGN